VVLESPAGADHHVVVVQVRVLAARIVMDVLSVDTAVDRDPSGLEGMRLNVEVRGVMATVESGIVVGLKLVLLC